MCAAIPCALTCSWSQTLVQEGLAERFIPLDFAEAETVVDRAMQVGGQRRRRTHSVPHRVPLNALPL